MSGLWHFRNRDESAMGGARDARTLGFDVIGWAAYRPAAPGTKEGDPYDESRYVARAPDVWHTEAPTVAGVYATEIPICCAPGTFTRHWNGVRWTSPISYRSNVDVRKLEHHVDYPVSWHHLIEADA